MKSKADKSNLYFENGELWLQQHGSIFPDEGAGGAECGRWGEQINLTSHFKKLISDIISKHPPKTEKRFA